LANAKVVLNFISTFAFLYHNLAFINAVSISKNIFETVFIILGNILKQIG